MSTYRLRLLGTPAVLDGHGHDVGLPLGKPLAALCYIALEESLVTRDDLASVLWNGASRAKARASVRQALWLIRSRTTEGLIVEDDRGLRLDPGVVETDLSSFPEATEADDPSHVWELWSGGLMVGLSVPDAPAWQAWADRQRGRFERRVGEALEVAAASATGTARLEWLEKAVQVRPYRDAVLRSRVETLVELHRPGEAEAALDHFEAVADELDPDEVDRLRALIRALRRDRFDSPSEGLPLEFVGRAEPFSWLTAHWRSAQSGRSRVVGVIGPEGIGKSRFGRQFLALAEYDGASVVEAQGLLAERHLALGVATSLTRGLLKLRGAAGISLGASDILGSLVPSRLSEGGPADLPATTLVADSFADLLEAVSEEGPVVVMVEDIHWCDAPSLNVLLRAMRHVREARALLLVTCRTDVDGEALAALRGLAEAKQASLIELHPLRPVEVAELLGLVLHETSPGALEAAAERLHGVSGGNPLHLESLLHTLRDEGRLRRDEGAEWVLDLNGLDALALPDSVTRTLERRFAALSDEARRLATELAASERPLPPEELIRRSRMSEAEGTRALGALMTHDLVRWTRDDRVAFVHESSRTQMAATDEPANPWEGGFIRIGALALFLVLAFVTADFVAAGPGPFDGHGIWLRSGDVHLRATPVEELGADGWALTDTVEIPVGMQARVPFRSGDGSWILYGYSDLDLRAAPDAVLYRNGVFDTVFASIGDDAVAALDPTGTGALLNVQHPDTVDYRSTLVRIDLASRDTATLASGDLGVTGHAWSRDGARILATVDAPWDTALVLRPDGERLHVLASPDPELGGFHECGVDRLVVTTLEEASTTRHWIWNLGEPDPRPLGVDGDLSSRVVCDPSGRYVAYVAIRDGGDRLVVEEIGGGTLAELPLPDRGTHVVDWRGPPRPVPSQVRLRPDSVLLLRGDTSRVQATALTPQGEEVPAPIVWSTDDPAIASVLGDGLVWGNRNGRTWVRASVHGWIRDSVPVTVQGTGAARGVLMSDSFPRLDTTRWQLWGDPVPRAVRDDEGRPALEVPGDGRFTDGMISTADFRLDQGGTLEVSFRIREFSRPDRQRIRLCVVEATPGDPPELASAWTLHQQLCAHWPADELADFDPDRARVTLNRWALGAIPLDGALEGGAWNRLALTLRPDGRALLFANDQMVFESPVRVENGPDVRWRIVITGAAQDTELLVRDIVLWDQERPEPDAGG